MVVWDVHGGGVKEVRELCTTFATLCKNNIISKSTVFKVICICSRVLQKTRTNRIAGWMVGWMVIFRKSFIVRTGSHNCGGWGEPWPEPCRLGIPESQWCSSKAESQRSEGVNSSSDVNSWEPEAWRAEDQCSSSHSQADNEHILPSSSFVFWSGLNRLGKAHPHWEGQPTLLSSPIQC